MAHRTSSFKFIAPLLLLGLASVYAAPADNGTTATLRIESISARVLAKDLLGSAAAREASAKASGTGTVSLVLYEGRQEPFSMVQLPPDPDRQAPPRTNPEGVRFLHNESRVGFRKNEYTKSLDFDPLKVSLEGLNRAVARDGQLRVAEHGGCLVVQDAALHHSADWALDRTIGSAVEGPVSLSDAMRILRENGMTNPWNLNIEALHGGEKISDGFTADTTVREVLLAALQYTIRTEARQSAYQVKPVFTKADHKAARARGESAATKETGWVVMLLMI